MLIKIVTVAVWAAVAGVGAAYAQKISDIGGPSELPPPSYKSGQYVDSRGCVFLRAGYGGNTNWVPRVSSSRKVLCGYPPSLAAQVEVAEAPVAQPVSPKPAVRAAGAPLDTVASLTTAPKIRQPTVKSRIPAKSYAAAPVVNLPSPGAMPLPRQVAVIQPAAPQPAVVPTEAGRRAAGCPPNAPIAERVMLADGRSATLCSSRAGLVARVAAPTVVSSAPRVTAAPAYAGPQYQAVPRYAAAPQAYAQASGVRVGCPASSPVAQRYATTDGGSAVFCTTAAGGPSAAVALRYAGVPAAQAGDRVASYLMSSKATPTPPKGYRQAWKDGRLNPARGQLTRPGQAAPDQVWTRDVPAKLIAEVPLEKLRLVELPDGTEYFISTRSGHRPKGAVLRRVEARQQVAVSSKSQVVSTKSQSIQRVVVSTKAEPRFKTGGGYVQVGTFGQPGNATKAKARLAGLGLPVAESKIIMAGKAMQIVLAGPFADSAQMQNALAAARRAGFSDAFIRK